MGGHDDALPRHGGAGNGGGVLCRRGGGGGRTSGGSAARNREIGRQNTRAFGFEAPVRHCRCPSDTVCTRPIRPRDLRNHRVRHPRRQNAGHHHHAVFCAGRTAADRAHHRRQARRGCGVDTARKGGFLPGALGIARVLPETLGGRRENRAVPRRAAACQNAGGGWRLCAVRHSQYGHA